MYGGKAREIGWRASPEEDTQIRLLRPDLLRLVAVEGEDEELAAQAADLAQEWLLARQTLDADMVRTVLRIAAHYGDRTLFEQLKSEAQKTKDRNELDHLFAALGSFQQPELVKASLILMLTPDFDTRDSIGILDYALEDPQTRDAAYSFLKEKFQELIRKLPREYASFFPLLASDFCDQEHREDVAAFFGAQANIL